MSLDQFFERDDPEKQFLYRIIQDEPDPAAAMENFRNCIASVNSPEHYRQFAESGFYTYVRSGDSIIEDALQCIEKHFKLENDLGDNHV